MGRERANERASVDNTTTSPAALILTPGASADRNSPALVAIEEGLPEIVVERLTLATTSVPNAVKKIRAAAEDLAGRLAIQPDRIAFGGRSFGGRSCSVGVAEGLAAHSLILLSYPLHPPGKPEKLRVEHFPDLTVPSMFISGTKDPFGTSDEFERHCATITGPVRLESVPGNHAPKGQDDTIIALIRNYWGLD